jgi:hypothetical protein
MNNKRKREASRDNCSICKEAGRNRTGHLAEFCAYPGGRYEGDFAGAARAKKGSQRQKPSETGGAHQASIYFAETNTFLHKQSEHITNNADEVRKIKNSTCTRDMRIGELESTINMQAKNQQEQQTTIDKLVAAVAVLQRNDQERREEAAQHKGGPLKRKFVTVKGKGKGTGW